MHVSGHGRWVAALLGAGLGAGLAGGLLLGCANPGSPRPPSLRLPSPVAGLQAERVGPNVLLHWTTPASTTDGDTIRFPVTAVVCRQQVLAHGAGICQLLRRSTVAPGPGSLDDALPGELRLGPDVLLLYRVTLLNGSDRSAPAAVVYAAAGEAPAPVGALHAKATRQGALLTWIPVTRQAFPDSHGAAAVMNLRRTGPPVPGQGSGGGLAGRPNAAGSGTPSAGKARGGKNVKPTSAPPPVSSSGTGAPLANTEVELQPDRGGGQSAVDPGGTVDRGVRNSRLEGADWTYVAQRVRTVDLDGHRLELRGLPSAPVAFTWHDSFAPAAPTGLVSVPSLLPPSIDLSWEPSFDTDVVGYNIYRVETMHPATPVKLNSSPVTSVSYRDLAVHPGATYRYRVTAVGAHGIESPSTADVEETIHGPDSMR